MQGRLKNRKIGDRVLVAEFAVPEVFTFQPGEYIRLILPGELKHYFSIASSPNERGLIRIATRPSAGGFKKTLAEMPLGTEVEIKGPWGDVLLPEDFSKPLVFIAGGIGITPFLSMIGYIAENKLPYEIKLLYFNQERDSIPFFVELQSFEKQIPNLKIYFLSTLGHNAPVPSYLKRGERGVIYYTAGPPGFVNESLNLLAELKIPPERIISESYTGY